MFERQNKMTGGTLLTRSGSNYYLTKVAHDGFDLEDLAEKLSKLDIHSLNAKEVVVAYLQKRAKDGMGDFDPLDTSKEEDIEKCVFARKVKTKYFDKALEVLEEALEEEINNPSEETSDMDDEHPYMQLSCSYTDYVLYVDCDTGMIALNGDLYENYKKNKDQGVSEHSHSCGDSCGHSHAHEQKDEGSEEQVEEEKKLVDELGTSKMTAGDFLFEVYSLQVPGMGDISMVNVVPKSYFQVFGCMYDGHMELGHLFDEKYEYEGAGVFLTKGKLQEVKQDLIDKGFVNSVEFSEWLKEASGGNKTEHDRLMEEFKKPDQDQINAMWDDFMVEGEPNDASDFFAAIRSAKCNV